MSLTEPSHEPVLVTEVLELLSPRDGEIYVDCTVGLGGHSTAIVDAAPNCQLVGFDRDDTALQRAGQRLGNRAMLLHGELGDLPHNVAAAGLPRVDGLIADLGVSSMQLDTAERGFSFAKEGPLDMRMDPSRGPTVRELVRTLDVEQLGDTIAELGEERYARRIARMIKEAVREERLHTTLDLARLCERAIPAAEQRKSRIHPATRTFQALRIAVNNELDQLARFLAVFPDVLAPGGRCVVIAFHSLEDRLVKQRFRDLAWTSSLPPRLAAGAGERVLAVCEPLTGKPIVASDAEVARNPRARSARLRGCARTAAPHLPQKIAPPAGRIV
jgi:16S rRNA (cytosine1402-N4)-methyltransferase